MRFNKKVVSLLNIYCRGANIKDGAEFIQYLIATLYVYNSV